MSDKKESKPAEAGAVPKKSPMMMIVIAVAVVAMVAMFVVGKQVSAKGKPAAVKKVEHGPTMSLDEFLVNLSDSDGDHFLKVTVALGLDKEKGKTPESLKEQTPMIRDAVLAALSSKMRTEVSSADGREKLKADIKKRVNSELGEGDVDDVYFSNFVTQ